MSPSTHNGETVRRSLLALLENHPDASIAALAPSGTFVDLPESLASTGHAPTPGRWTLDLVAPGSRLAVTTAWGEAQQRGVSHVAVELADGTDGIMHFFDLRDSEGNMILVVVPAAAGIASNAHTISPEVTPRYGVVIRNDSGYAIRVDDAVLQMLRCEPDHIIGVWPLDLIHPDDHKRAIDNWIDMFASEGVPRRYRGRVRRGDDQWLWVEFTNHLRRTSDGTIEIVSEMVDISEEMAMHEALRASEEFLRRLTSALPVAVGQLDLHGNLVYANERLLALSPATSQPRAHGEAALISIVELEHRPLLETALAQARRGEGTADIELPMTTPEGRARVYRASFCALRDGDTITGTLLTLTDVTESADLREALRKRATYDDLTGLHNRASIMALLANSLREDRDAGRGTAVVFVDLDDFKDINDEFGHAAGDDVLARVAGRLRAAVRRHDLVGRIGGDEFLVVCPGVSDPSTAYTVAERVGRHLQEELDIAGQSRTVRASIGVAWGTDPEATPESLIRAADAAMYESKRRGKGRPVLADAIC
ncbi:MAG TPA: sensor domain-containing diguanylate cyclase [Acidimicrobiales bacterium]